MAEMLEITGKVLSKREFHSACNTRSTSLWRTPGADFKMFWRKLRKKFGSPKLLCDTCEYDYPSACYNPKRPNATTCPDYKRR